MSTSGDVYSYGILLLEIFTGKKPTDDMFREGLNLHELAKSALLDVVIAILDPVLLQDVGAMEANTNCDILMECLTSIVGIGVSCSEETPTGRLIISDVALELCSIRNKLLGNRRH